MSKTVDELAKTFRAGLFAHLGANPYATVHEGDRAGVAAVIRALRDEIVPERMRITRANDTCTRSSLRRYFNEILGDAGEKVAIKETAIGAVLRMEAGDPPTPATDPAPVDVAKMQRALLRKWRKAHSNPAPAVCVWVPYTDENLGANWWRSCRGVRHRYSFDGHHPCPSCGLPIKFTEAKT